MEFPKYETGAVMQMGSIKVKLVDWWEYPAEDDRHAIIYWDVIILEGMEKGITTTVKQRHLRANVDTESV